MKPGRNRRIQSDCATSAPENIIVRGALLKIGARVTISVRRVKLAFASACPDCEVFTLAARRL